MWHQVRRLAWHHVKLNCLENHLRRKKPVTIVEVIKISEIIVRKRRLMGPQQQVNIGGQEHFFSAFKLPAHLTWARVEPVRNQIASPPAQGQISCSPSPPVAQSPPLAEARDSRRLPQPHAPRPKP